MSRHPEFVPQGVIPAVLLPFHNDLSIDEQSFRAHLRDVAAVQGLSAITVNAHSTEVASCTLMASVYREVPFDDLDAGEWDRQMAVDLRATFLTSMAAVPHMRAQGGGRIVNFTDWIAASGRPRYRGFLPYYVAKAGVKALTEALALELAGDRILVNAVAPGPIVPPRGTTSEVHAAVERATPLGRWGGEGEIAKAVAFLCETDFVTGETIRVDGGRHVK